MNPASINMTSGNNELKNHKSLLHAAANSYQYQEMDEFVILRIFAVVIIVILGFVAYKAILKLFWYDYSF
jgi:hypothetical protein